MTKLNHTNIQFKGKYFEDNVGKKTYWMKLIFKIKEQECDFIRGLIKMDKFQYFPLRGIPIWPSRRQVDISRLGRSDNF